jgi:Mannosyl-glycoprotein endo-beta-N-acetylglucosaminidase
LDAYTAARDYVRRAEAGARAAAGSVQDAINVWDTSKLDVLKALAAVKRARATVRTYKQALAELGLAVYTGAAVTNVNYLGSEESQLEQTDLAAVAAVGTTDGIHRSERALAQSIVNVGKARATVRADWGKVRQAKAAQKGAIAQVTLSRKDVSVAKLWATLPGTAPLQPVQSLALLEGEFAPRPSGSHDKGPSSSGRAASTVTALASSTEAAQAAEPITDPPPSLQAMAGYGPSILGSSLLTASQVADWFASTGYHARVTVPFGQLVDDYFKAARLTGVRADIAFAQSVIETGYFSFPSYGQDAPSFNNFAGIGACDTCKHGWSFPSAMTGVLSQEELLEVYATPAHPTAAYGKPSSNFGIAGCCSTWMSLAGTWASAGTYGYDILNIYNQMLAWALPRDLQSAGLLSSSARPHGPPPASRPVKPSPAPSRTPPT